jgi:hypothetical protein
MTERVETQKVLRAERLEIVDSEGRVRARIGPRSRRADGETWRSYRLEMFDTRGTIIASLSVEDGVAGSDDVDHVARFRVGEEYGTSVELEASDRERFSTHSSVTIDSGSAGLRQVTCRAGSFPITRDLGPNMRYGVEERIADRYTLDRATHDAQVQVKVCREAARIARSMGLQREARRATAEARRLEERIAKSTAAFEEREAAQRASYSVVEPVDDEVSA